MLSTVLKNPLGSGSVVPLLAAPFLAITLLIAAVGVSAAEDATEAAEDGTQAGTDKGTVAIELNKLEASNNDCRVYFVINNKKDVKFDALKLELVLFRPDGEIGRRIAIDLAPLKAKKRTVKSFEVADTACDDVGSFLINDVMECTGSSGDVTDCFSEITASSRTGNDLSK